MIRLLEREMVSPLQQIEINEKMNAFRVTVTAGTFQNQTIPLAFLSDRNPSSK